MCSSCRKISSTPKQTPAASSSVSLWVPAPSPPDKAESGTGWLGVGVLDQSSLCSSLKLSSQKQSSQSRGPGALLLFRVSLIFCDAPFPALKAFYLLLLFFHIFTRCGFCPSFLFCFCFSGLCPQNLFVLRFPSGLATPFPIRSPQLTHHFSTHPCG